ncbi:unnamed protein product, partial [Ixodes pacificus]
SLCFQITVYLGMFLFIIFLIWRCFKKPPVYEIPARDISKGHRWSVTDILSRTGYCSICENLIVDGLFCDSCGICVDHGCRSAADKSVLCKILSCTGSAIKHHWVKGNTSPNSLCTVCEKLCGLEAALVDFRCCWCQRTVHTKCADQLGDVCDLGSHRAFVVPPFCVRLRMVGWKGRRHLVVKEVARPPFDPWNPLIVVANRKSGNNDGEVILSVFRGILNPAQVSLSSQFSILAFHESQLETGLRTATLLRTMCNRLYIEGTSLTTQFSLPFFLVSLFTCLVRIAAPFLSAPSFARLQSGREANTQWRSQKGGLWGFNSSPPPKSSRLSYIHMTFGPPSLSPHPKSWTYQPPQPPPPPSDRCFEAPVLSTYDTQIAELALVPRVQLLYFTYGTRDILEKKCKNLHQKVRLWLDNEEVGLQELEAITVLNIPSWGAGVRPWHMG